MIANGLKLSPKKCQLFRTSIDYMGNKMFIKNKRVCITPLGSRIEAIQKLNLLALQESADHLEV